MIASTQKLRQVQVLRGTDLATFPASGVWSLDALTGRFVEVTGPAALTAAAQVVLQAQRKGLFAAWIGDARSCAYPPDLAASGIDLAAFPVIRAPDALAACRAADTLIRSGGFAAVLLDCRDERGLSLAMQTRLAGLAQQHGAVLLHIAGMDRRSSLASLRVDTARRRVAFNRFACDVRAAKDKRAAPGWTSNEVHRGPMGLC